MQVYPQKRVVAKSEPGAPPPNKKKILGASSVAQYGQEGVR